MGLGMYPPDDGILGRFFRQAIDMAHPMVGLQEQIVVAPGKKSNHRRIPAKDDPDYPLRTDTFPARNVGNSSGYRIDGMASQSTRQVRRFTCDREPGNHIRPVFRLRIQTQTSRYPFPRQEIPK